MKIFPEELKIYTVHMSNMWIIMTDLLAYLDK